MPTVTFHMVNDSPIIETLPDDTTRADVHRRAEYHGAICYDVTEADGEFNPYCESCGRKLRYHEDVGTYCPSGCRVL